MPPRKNPVNFRGKDKIFYERLLHERSKILGQFNIYKKEILDTTVNDSNERLGMSTHMADIGGDTFQNEVEIGRMTADSEVLEMIEDAIERLITGDYGTCLECGIKIAEERLMAKPHAIRCIDCANQKERSMR